MVQTCGWQTMAAYNIWWESLLRNPHELVTITVKWKCVLVSDSVQAILVRG